MLTRQAMILATIRTAVPAAIGWVLAALIARIPAVADIIATIDRVLAEALPDAPAVTVTTILNAAGVGLAVAGYYWAARELGRRWPIIERYLLGSSAQPIYAKQDENGVYVITAALPDTAESSLERYQDVSRRPGPRSDAPTGL